MYTITRKNRIKEDLQLCHANGETALTISVDLNIDEVASRVNKAYEVLGMAQTALEKAPNSQDAMEAYGNAVIAVFNVIFGEDGTAKLLDFYEGHMTEMLLDLFPFINDEILPKIREASAARKEQMASAIRATKKNKRPGFWS